MSATATRPEFERLRHDIEIEASKYHDLTLSTYIVTQAKPDPDLQFRKPNHAISLWQYAGQMQFQQDIEDLAGRVITRFGMSNALVNAFAVIEGEETHRFCRLATRAGSLLPTELVTDLGKQIMKNAVNFDIEGKPVFVCNPNPLAAWLNLVLTCITTYQPERFGYPRLAVDPYAASLAVFDYMIDGKVDERMKDPISQTTLATTRFKVALSFPGEKRGYVGKVADILHEQLGEVFYDYFYEAELARPNLDTLLQTIYRSNSDLVVVFLCEEYERKDWCGLEWRAVRDLIKVRSEDCIMFMRFDDAIVSGVFSIDGYIDLRRRSPQEAAALIVQRHALIHQQSF